MRDYVERNFVSKGMCAEFAIHDSENKETGQRNLHCHIMLTIRGIDEYGQWMQKSKKNICWMKIARGFRLLIKRQVSKKLISKIVNNGSVRPLKPMIEIVTRMPRYGAGIGYRASDSFG